MTIRLTIRVISGKIIQFIILSIFFVISQSTKDITQAIQDREPDMIKLRKITGSGCPYAASWILHVQAFRKIRLNLITTKMEASSFAAIDPMQHKYQIDNPGLFYVHHLSGYEHHVHKFLGFEQSIKRTEILTNASYNGECGSLKLSKRNNILSIIPFFGGLPPGVTSDHKVKSIGQGNSLVNSSVKAKQLMSTICSNLKYYRYVIVGVTREQDFKLVRNMVYKEPTSFRHHVNIVYLETIKPAHLPAQLIHWTQKFVRETNCGFYDKLVQFMESKPKNSDIRIKLTDYLNKNDDMFHICTQPLARMYKGEPSRVIHSLKEHFLNSTKTIRRKAMNNSTFLISSNVFGHPIRFVYYTENDQVLVFKNQDICQSILDSLNSTTIILGRRKEKLSDSNPEEYLNGLNIYRTCGSPGYYLSPQTHFIQRLK